MCNQMQKIIDYDFAWGICGSCLVAQVKLMMSEGWQPYGQAFQTPSNGQFYQTMVKYEKEQ